MTQNGHPNGYTDYFSPRKASRKLADTRNGLVTSVKKFTDGARDALDQELEVRRSAIGGVDNLWLLLAEASDQEFQPHCAATYTLRGKLTKEKTVELLRKVVEMFPRYADVLIDKGDDFHGARFQQKPNFDPAERVTVVRLPGKAGKEELEAEVGKLLAKPWDLSEPLWQVEVVENYHDEDGAESAMIMKGHHLCADGKGYVLSQLAITSYLPDLETAMGNKVGEPKPPAKRPQKPSELDEHLKGLDPLFQNHFAALLFQVIVVYLLGSIVAVFGFFEHFVYSVLHLADSTYMYATVAWRQTYISASYLGRRVYEREFAVSNVFALADVKLCQQAFSGLPPGALPTKAYGHKTVAADRLLHHITLNDVLCAVMADVLAHEMATVGPAPGRWPRFVHWVNAKLPPRVGLFIPINIRQPGEWEMTNLTTAAITFLEPLRKNEGETTSMDVYKHVGNAHRKLMLLKKSWLPKIAWAAWHYSLRQLPILWPFPGFLVKGSLLRKYLGEPIVSGFITSFSAILTNIPGPYDKKVSLGDMEVIKWTALPPQAGKGTCAIGVISYAEGISVSVAADCLPSSKGAARRLCEGFEKRFQFYVDVSRRILEDSGNLTP